MKPIDLTPGAGKNLIGYLLVFVVALPGMMGVTARAVNHQANDMVETQSVPPQIEQSIQNNESRYVRIVYLIPADSIEKPEYTQALENAVRHLRIWYFNELGQNKTFTIHDPVVEVYQTPHEALWYSTNSNGNPFYWFWNNVLEDGFALTGGTRGDDNNIWVFYMDANPACGQCGGCGQDGTVVISANDLKGLIGDEIDKTCPEIIYSYEPCRYVGGMGHELGHALGLSHPPECDEAYPDCWDHDLMMYGYITYPDAFLNEASKIILDNSPFIGEADLDGFTFPCSCMDLTDSSTICRGSQISILCGDSILLEGAYQYASGIFHDTIDAEEGCDTLVVTYLTVAIPPPEVNTDYVSVCEGEIVPVLIAAGENLKWYSDAGLSDLIYSGDSLETGQTAAGTYQYYVTQTYAGCTSPSVQVTLTIMSTPQTPVTGDTASCEGEYVDNLKVDSHNELIRWYADPELTNPLSYSDNLNVSDITEPGTYIFYVTRTMECESLPGTFTYTINPVPPEPVVEDVSICENESSAILAADGENITWYRETDSNVIDMRDRQVYKGVQIGNQVWMAENLNYYTSTGSWYYNDDSISFSGLYGRLYDFQVAPEVCPSGWHLPDLSEWNEMITFLGGDSIAGGKLKAADTLFWVSPNTGATDETGFHALPGGHSVYDAYFNLGEEAIFWTSTWGYESGRVFKITSDSPSIAEGRLYMDGEGASVRCVKDSIHDRFDIIEFGDTLVVPNTQTGIFPFYATQTISNCQSPADSAILQIYASPRIDLGNDTTISVNQEITLDIGLTDYLYRWSDGSDLPQCKISGSEVGPGDHIYWVVVTDINSCAASDSIEISVTDPTNTAFANVRDPITIFPNPVQDLLSIQTMATGKHTVEIATMSGKIIHNGDLTSSSLQINLSSFQKGIYIITVRSKDFVTRRKIVKY